MFLRLEIFPILFDICANCAWILFEARLTEPGTNANILRRLMCNTGSPKKQEYRAFDVFRKVSLVRLCPKRSGILFGAPRSCKNDFPCPTRGNLWTPQYDLLNFIYRTRPSKSRSSKSSCAKRALCYLFMSSDGHVGLMYWSIKTGSVFIGSYLEQSPCTSTSSSNTHSPTSHQIQKELG